MTRGLGLRQYRACTRCRTRKTRCDLLSTGDPGRPPCAKCLREGADCTLAPSRRGGDFSHLRRKNNRNAAQRARSTHAAAPTSLSSASPPAYQEPSSRTALSALLNAPRSSAPVHDSLQNPSDALQILAHATGLHCGEDESTAFPSAGNRDETAGAGGSDVNRTPGRPMQPDHATPRSAVVAGTCDTEAAAVRGRTAAETIQSYPLIREGKMDAETVAQLLQWYVAHYHPLFPIAPAAVLQPTRLADTVENEPFLLTAVLVVALIDHPTQRSLYQTVWAHMRLLILDVVLGMASVRTVGCVEGLLLLGEWTLLSQPEERQAPVGPGGSRDDGGEGAAWSMVGLAVRLAYLLRLEDSSFKGLGPGQGSERHREQVGIGHMVSGGAGAEDALAVDQRRRLAWMFTYLSDRQISIRMGQAFWCRGPALSTRFTAQDFPSLQPKHPGDDDYASLLQAQVELTTLFGNVHDILFASQPRTAEVMRRGDYSKYIDDTSKAMAAWRRAWHSIDVSPFLRSCLALMHEYLRLYVNAFAFQAVLYRASIGGGGGSSGTNSRSNERTTTHTATSTTARSLSGTDPVSAQPASRPRLSFPDSAMASPDARPIYEAVDAAKSLLAIVADDIDPVQHLRYMPARFYLYEIHSAVFLYKAYAAGAVSPESHAQTTELMQRFLSALQCAAIDDSHMAARYARLLRRLWFHHGRAGISEVQGQADTHPTHPGVQNEQHSGLSPPASIPDLPPPPLAGVPATMNGKDGCASASSAFEDYTYLGPTLFDCPDTMDSSLFAIPPVMFPWDQESLFLNPI